MRTLTLLLIALFPLLAQADPPGQTHKPGLADAARLLHGRGGGTSCGHAREDGSREQAARDALAAREADLARARRALGHAKDPVDAWSRVRTAGEAVVAARRELAAVKTGPRCTSCGQRHAPRPPKQPDAGRRSGPSVAKGGEDAAAPAPVGERPGPLAGCRHARLILIWQTASGEDPSIEAAKTSVLGRYGVGGDNLRILWRRPHQGSNRGYRPAEGGWERVGNIDASIGEDTAGRDIDCYDQVLVVYHGRGRASTDAVLNFLRRHTEAPIRELTLWSCYGAEQVDLGRRAFRQFASAMDDRAEDGECAHRFERLLTAGTLRLTPGLATDLAREISEYDAAGDRRRRARRDGWRRALRNINRRLETNDLETGWSTPLGVRGGVLTASGSRLRTYTRTGEAWTFAEAPATSVFTDYPVEDEPALDLKGAKHWAAN